MIYYKVTHKHKLIDHDEYKKIGIYSSMNNAEKAVEFLSSKSGFKENVDGFRIRKVFRLFEPKLIDKTFWVDGFDTYTY